MYLANGIQFPASSFSKPPAPRAPSAASGGGADEGAGDNMSDSVSI